jgi:hypothetical protein
MHFVYPTFLFALAALAIPIIIHLFHFRRFKKVVFSDIRFLKSVQEQTRSTRKIKDLLILLARLFAIASLIFAFAKPYLGTQQNGVEQSIQGVSIFFDNSPSMLLEGEEGPLLEQAKRLAKTVIESMPEQYQFQLITNESSFGTSKPLAKSEALEKIPFIELSNQTRTVEEILAMQQGWFSSFYKGNNQLWWISDFQASVFHTDILQQLDSTTNIQAIKLSALGASNMSIDSVWFDAPFITSGEPVAMQIRIKKYGQNNPDDVPVSLSLNGVKKSMAIASGQNEQILSMEFTANKGLNEGFVQIEDFPLSFDDKMYFTFSTIEQIPVLVINGQRSNPYLRALLGTDERIQVKEYTLGNIDYSSIKSATLVIFNEVSTVSSGLKDEMQRYLNLGGQLLVIPAETQLQASNELLFQLGAPTFQSINKQVVEVNSINQTHSLFKTSFSKIPRSAELPKVNAYASLQIQANTRGTKLIGLANGDALLWHTPYKNANIYLLTVPLQTSFSNLPKHALFVPMLLNMCKHSRFSIPLYYTSGKNYEFLFGSDADLSGDKNILFASEKQKWVSPVKNTESGMATTLQLNEIAAGIYQITSQRNEQELGKLAVNDDRIESNITPLSNTDLEALSSLNMQKSGQQQLAYAILNDFGQTQLWRLFLFAALFFLLVEILIIRLIK